MRAGGAAAAAGVRALVRAGVSGNKSSSGRDEGGVAVHGTLRRGDFASRSAPFPNLAGPASASVTGTRAESGNSGASRGGRERTIGAAVNVSGSLAGAGPGAAGSGG